MYVSLTLSCSFFPSIDLFVPLSKVDVICVCVCVSFYVNSCTVSLIHCTFMSDVSYMQMVTDTFCAYPRFIGTLPAGLAA
jgi:hypothetical protein